MSPVRDAASLANVAQLLATVPTSGEAVADHWCAQCCHWSLPLAVKRRNWSELRAEGVVRFTVPLLFVEHLLYHFHTRIHQRLGAAS